MRPKKLSPEETRKDLVSLTNLSVIYFFSMTAQIQWNHLREIFKETIQWTECVFDIANS